MIKILGNLFLNSSGEINISFILSIIATTISLASIYIHYSNYIERKAKIKVELLPIKKINRQICFSLYSNNYIVNDIGDKPPTCDKNKFSAILHTRIINKSEKPIYIIEFIFKISSKEIYLFNKNSYREDFIIDDKNNLRVTSIELLKPIIKLEPYEVIEGYIKFAPLPKFDIIKPIIIMKTSRKNIKVRIGSIDFNSYYISLLDLCKQ